MKNSQQSNLESLMQKTAREESLNLCPTSFDTLQTQTQLVFPSVAQLSQGQKTIAESMGYPREHTHLPSCLSLLIILLCYSRVVTKTIKSLYRWQYVGIQGQKQLDIGIF